MRPFGHVTSRTVSRVVFVLYVLSLSISDVFSSFYHPFCVFRHIMDLPLGDARESVLEFIRLLTGSAGELERSDVPWLLRQLKAGDLPRSLVSRW